MDPTNILAIITKKIFRIKIPLILSIHTNIELAYKERMKYIRFLISHLYSSKSIDKIITISKEVKKFLYMHYNIQKGKIKTVYNGIDIEEIQKKTSEKIGIYKETFYDNAILKFINIGRLIDIKGHKYLINTFSKVKKAIPNSKLYIIGEGPLLPILKSFVKDLNLEQDITFLGLVRNPYKYLFNSNIFVLSSLHEGLPTVLLEALACGVPIISTNCKTGPKEILGENDNYGILVKVKDSGELARKMIMLGKNTELRDFYLKMSLIRAKKFDINLIQKKWIKIIETLLSNKK